jgi:hypothetical protein
VKWGSEFKTPFFFCNFYHGLTQDLMPWPHGFTERVGRSAVSTSPQTLPLKMETPLSSETLVPYYNTTRHQITEVHDLNFHWRKNLKPPNTFPYRGRF